MASQNGHVEVVKALLAESQIKVNQAETKGGSTPLFIASQFGHVETLIAHPQIKVNQAWTDYGTTPLSIASQNGKVEVVKELLSHPEHQGRTCHSTCRSLHSRERAQHQQSAYHGSFT